METTVRLRDTLLTMLAPLAWATTYVVTKEWLPENRPFFSALIRSLPLGLLIVVARRQLPRGSWWWKAAVLGVCNIGLFFALLFVGAYLLPGGTASTLQATSPLAVTFLAAVLLGERARRATIVGSLLGAAGVALLVLRPGSAIDPLGVAAALGSVAISAVGFVLVKRWRTPVDPLTLTGWQLVAGGLLLLPVSLIIEGPWPTLDGPAIGGYLWLAIVGTGLAYVVWFRGLQLMPAAATALLGLVNPVVATMLGVWISHEAFGAQQALGMALVFVGILLGQPAIQRRLPGHRQEAAAPTRRPVRS